MLMPIKTVKRASAKSLDMQPSELQAIPEPYRTKAHALLLPWHPFFVFELQALDPETLDFRIGLRNLFCRKVWTHDRFPQASLLGAFPLALFEQVDQVKAWSRFEAYVFHCLTRFVDEGLAGESRGLRQRLPLVYASHINWRNVSQWLGLMTDPLSYWFDRLTYESEGQQRFVLTQPRLLQGGPNGADAPGWLFRDIGQELRPWHAVQPTDLSALPVREIEAECREIAAAQGVMQADARLKKLLLERVVNGLYFLKFAL